MESFNIREMCIGTMKPFFQPMVPVVLPLPKGEGRGEGEGIVRQPNVHELRRLAHHPTVHERGFGPSSRPNPSKGVVRNPAHVR
jgi:hypothetical protein